MRSRRNARAETLAAALADGAAVDWKAEELAATDADAAVVRQLRVIAEMHGRRRPAGVSRWPWVRVVVDAACDLGVALAAVKVAVAAVVMGTALARGTVAPGAGPFAFNLVAFGLGGFVMILGGEGDRRLRLLGGLYVTLASAFVDPFLQPAGGPTGVLLAALGVCRSEAFALPAFWRFATAFPREWGSGRMATTAALAFGATTVLAWLIVAANGAPSLSSWAGLHLGPVLALLDRQDPSSWYWPSLFLLGLPAAVMLLAKAFLETAERRRAVLGFLGALLLGLAPGVAAAVATPFVPALGDPEVRRKVGLVVYLGLGTIVPMTAYAVGVQRVMDLQFVFRATLHYALARSAIWAAILVPLTYLAVDIFLNREMTVLAYVETRQPAGGLALSALGLAALALRPQLVWAVDRWFLREPLDSPLALARLERRLRTVDSLRDISEALGDELRHGLHASRTAVLLAQPRRPLVSFDDAVPRLSDDSVLADLLRSTRSELLIEPGSGIARLLPPDDQDWLDDVGAHLLAPLVGASGRLIGIAAVGPGANGLPYTARHVALAVALCGHAAMKIENRWLWGRQGEDAADSSASGLAWRDEPAAWCPNCSEVLSPDTRRCRCGAPTRAAVLPLFVTAKFRLHRMLGAGGAGVVYLATDLALDRQVAIKTLPRIGPEFAARLRREARAMALVRHPNLATIYGVEEWRETPLLVVEYLEGGTLLDRLAGGPLPVEDVLELGVVLADALDRVHGSGVLHRDIKPSNIGYSSDGVPKLLDFGLAAMLDRTIEPVVEARGPVPASGVRPGLADPAGVSTLTATDQVVGTPLYLAPEALAGQAPRESFDLWSLCMVLYEGVAGCHPFRPHGLTAPGTAAPWPALPDVRQFRPECPEAVALFLADALSPSERRRPASAPDLRSRLRELLALGMETATSSRR